MKTSIQAAIERAKHDLIEALHYLNTYPVPSSHDLALSILWVGMSTIHLREADPNEEALDIADQIFARVASKKLEAP